MTYPDGGFAAKLRDLARVIRAGEGLEVAALDLGGWDTHATQGAAQGNMANLLGNLAQRRIPRAGKRAQDGQDRRRQPYGAPRPLVE